MTVFSPVRDQPVVVTNLDDPDAKLPGRMTSVSRHGFGLMVDQPVSPGSAVRVDFDGNLLLAEVCYCRKRRDGPGYAVGLRAEHVLTGTKELEELVDAVMGKSERIR